MANPLLGIVIIHSLLHLMISSSIPSPAFGVYSSISISLQLGGCQQEVKQDDEISFAFDTFNANSFLKLTGLPIVALNFPIILTVTDVQTDNPVTGATVNGATTYSNKKSGKVSVIFTQVGTQEVKATKPGARSNQITVHRLSLILEEKKNRSLSNPST